MILLAVETATEHISVALLEDKTVIAEKEGLRQANKTLIHYIRVLFEESQISKQELELLVVDHGPGRFTAIRTGITAARTLGQIKKIPIIGLDSLEILRANAEDSPTTQTLIPLIHTRQSTVHTKIPQIHGNAIHEYTLPQLTATIAGLPQPKITCIGTSPWQKALLSAFSSKITWHKDPHPHAHKAGILGYQKFLQGHSSQYHEIHPKYTKET